MRKTARYIHIDEKPRTVAGNGKNQYRSPAHRAPATKPNKALKGTLLRGFSARAKPVRISNPQEAISNVCASNAVIPVIIMRMPTKKPK